MRIALGSDHAGFHLKDQIRGHLREQGIACSDFGTFCESSVDYPDIACAVIRAVKMGEFPFGILICGTGVGMSIAANRFPGIRAALCADTYTARLSREHNDANVLTMGSRVVGPGLAISITDAFLQTSFQGGRHRRRLDKIDLLINGDRL